MGARAAGSAMLAGACVVGCLWANGRAAALPPPMNSGVQVSTTHGIEFATIGSPGNRAASIAEAPELYPPFSYPASPLGAVPHEFRISRAEVTAGQWLEFVRAYAPYHDNVDDPYNPRFMGEWTNVTTGAPGQVPAYSVRVEYENKPVVVGWDYAARFCNWLTNGKGTAPAAFLTGAYDLQSVTVGANGHWAMLPVRLPTATFWLPSLDEWSKAAFFDPNRYGLGQDGYWKYPNASNTPLVPGWPEQGGQTDAGIPYAGPSQDPRFNDVGAYATVQSPWGLFDLSGGETEWSDVTNGFLDSAVTRGSQRYEWASLIPERDRIDWGGYGGYAVLGYAGIRIATSVPAPPALLPLAMLGFFAQRARRVSPASRARHPESLTVG